MRDNKELIWGMSQAEGGNGEGKEPKAVDTVDNRIYFYSSVGREEILKLNKGIRKMDGELWREAQIQEREPASIFLHINSYGGGVFHGFAGMDAIRNTKVPVVIIIDGCCASAGTFLSVVGKRRLINRNAYMLIHQLSTFFWGKFSDLQDEQETCKRLMKTIKDIYLEYTKIPEKKLDEILKHDLWFNAKTCLKYGMVDEII